MLIIIDGRVKKLWKIYRPQFLKSKLPLFFMWVNLDALIGACKIEALTAMKFPEFLCDQVISSNAPLKDFFVHDFASFRISL